MGLLAFSTQLTAQTARAVWKNISAFTPTQWVAETNTQKMVIQWGTAEQPNLIRIGKIADDTESLVILSNHQGHEMLTIESPKYGMYKSRETAPGVYQLSPVFDTWNSTHAWCAVHPHTDETTPGLHSSPDTPYRRGIATSQPETETETNVAPFSATNKKQKAKAVVDVLVVYTTKSREKEGSTAAMINTIKTAVATANKRLDESSVTEMEFRLVHVREIARGGSGVLANDLRNLQNASDGVWDEVHAWRAESGADLVCLFTDADPNKTFGIASIPIRSGLRNQSFSIVATETANGVFLHEIAHNMGCNHNKSAGGASFFDYSYGHSWKDTDGTTVGSIMSYIGKRRPVYSSPNVKWNGNPAGDSTKADNVRTLNQTGAIVEQYTAAKEMTQLALSASSLSNTSIKALEEFYWDVDVSNLNAASASSVLVSLPIPDNMVFVDVVSGQGYDAASKIWTINQIPGNGKAQIRLRLFAKKEWEGQTATLKATINHSSATHIDFDLSDNEKSASIAVTPTASATNSPLAQTVLVPINGQLIPLKTENTGKATSLSLYNAMGQLVYRQAAYNPGQRIDIPNLAEGWYVLSVGKATAPTWIMR